MGDLAYHGMVRVLNDVAAERRRQIEEEGWTAAHDDAERGDGELALAAVCYALPEWQWDAIKTQTVIGEKTLLERLWPFSRSWWRPGPLRRMLIKAAALIIAEIERLDRAEAKRAEAP